MAYDKTTAGPAQRRLARPVVTKTPAPTMPPMPKPTRSNHLRVLIMSDPDRARTWLISSYEVETEPARRARRAGVWARARR